jgi:hypothetical protein
LDPKLFGTSCPQTKKKKKKKKKKTSDPRKTRILQQHRNTRTSAPLHTRNDGPRDGSVPQFLPLHLQNLLTPAQKKKKKNNNNNKNKNKTNQIQKTNNKVC